MRVFLICFVSLFFFVNSTCAYRCDEKCKELQKKILVYGLLLGEEKKEPEPNGSFEEAKCVHDRIGKFSGSSNYYLDYYFFIDNFNGQKDLDYFFVYSKSNTIQLLRIYPLSDISIEIFSGKESRKLLSPKTSQIIEYQFPSTPPPNKETRFLEEYDLGGEPFIYYKFSSQSLTDKREYYIFLPFDFSSYSTPIGQNTFLFQGEFSCSP